MIPQEPTIFSGTIRSNIDYRNKYSDAELWEALTICGLKEFVEERPQKLDSEIKDQGANMSVGERQLLCIAGALLEQPKVIVFDESTSSMDHETDSRIQILIKNRFKDSTVISIAHRLDTIVGYDRILVLDQGVLVEYDHPKNLLGNGGIFDQLAIASGQKHYEQLIKLANQ
jgi:ABC-type multidrug transport system fused ATPase/permease subunit